MEGRATCRRSCISSILNQHCSSIIISTSIQQFLSFISISVRRTNSFIIRRCMSSLWSPKCQCPFTRCTIIFNSAAHGRRAIAWLPVLTDFGLCPRVEPDCSLAVGRRFLRNFFLVEEGRGEGEEGRVF